MSMEHTLILVKPDGLKKSLTGDVLSRLSESKLVIIGAKVVRVSPELAKQHYSHLEGQPFFDELIRYLTGELHDNRRVLALVYRGENAIQKIRYIVGETNPELADPVSIRGAYGRITTSGVYENVVHASSDPMDAEREIKLWFSPVEIVEDLYPSKEVVIKEVVTRVWA